MADFTETSTFVTTISGVDNGDPVNAAETNNAPQQLTNRTRFIKDVIDRAVTWRAESVVGPGGDPTSTYGSTIASVGSFATLSGITTTVTPEVGDIIYVSCVFKIELTENSGTGSIHLRVARSSSSVAIQRIPGATAHESVIAGATLKVGNLHLAGRWVATHNELTTIELQGNLSASNTPTIAFGNNILLQVQVRKPFLA